ncbi:MAG TPA: thioredoxin domain-containing protein [Planctomycetaceae bacterium]|nr:thioredoxin domain-containing protein [Planctomycetaceae bacterium]
MTHTEAPQRKEPNRLANETSPYLLQHAWNPVDWHPWGEEALRLAREQDKPIFLSIGYSACHWCHVMEHESFEDPEIAKLMNDWFVCIKVDREERPDLDQIYMTAVQLITGRGGWPMSVFLTPELQPFFGGTYWPPRQRMGMPGFRDILEHMHNVWQTRRADALEAGRNLVQAIADHSSVPEGAVAPDADLLRRAAQQLKQSADRVHGGFGRAPKFPHPMDLRVLLRAWRRFQDDDALAVARLTLDKMAAGGIYDQLGGGFHRYSTDEVWLAPHFEKMLYDNALLTPVYVEAWQATQDPEYARIARETCDYVLREMTQPEGGFFSTQDADSEGEEGRFFVWSEAEVLEHLGADDARVFAYCYDVTPAGNWEGHNILRRTRTSEQASKVLGIDINQLEATLARARQKLFSVRSQRVWPGRDDKVLVGWNGLMIAALSQAAEVLDEPRYRDAARSAAEFILTKMRQPDGALLHAYKDGRARFNAYLDDYACLIDGLTELYQATFEARWLEAAVELADAMLARFHDPDGGGFYYTTHDHETLIARPKDLQDNATPSGNSMAAYALLRLGTLCSRNDFQDVAVETLQLIAPLAARYATAAGQALLAVDFLVGPAIEVAVVDGNNLDENAEVLRILRQPFRPNQVLARRFSGDSDESLSPALQPLLKGRIARDGATTVYICRQGTCGLPIRGPAALKQALEKQ